jgi:Tol biopolymer transport system component
MLFRSPTAVLLCVAAFAHAAPGADLQTAIFVMSLDGASVRKVIEVEGFTAHRAPRWSPDGKHLVFSARKAPGGLRVCFVCAADGTGLREIGPGDMPDWSPDGKQIVYDDRRTPGAIVVQNLDGQGSSEIASGQSPRWSPDGRKLAFRRDKNVHVLDLISGEEHALLSAPAYNVYNGMDWDPHSGRLVAIVQPTKTAMRQILILDAAQENQPLEGRLGIGIGGPISFSPDGKQLTYDFNFKIRLADVGQEDKPRLIPGQLGHNLHPDFSPDGKWIAFGSDRHTVNP